MNVREICVVRVTSEYVIVCGHVQSTYPSTYHYVNERRGTHAYVVPRSITFMDFCYRKWKFLNLSIVCPTIFPVWPSGIEKLIIGFVFR